MRWPPYHGAPSIESLNGEKGCDTDKGGGEREQKTFCFVLCWCSNGVWVETQAAGS